MNDESQFINAEQERDLVLDWLLAKDPNGHSLYRSNANFARAVDFMMQATIPALVIGYARQAEEIEQQATERLVEMMMQSPDPSVLAEMQAAIQVATETEQGGRP